MDEPGRRVLLRAAAAGFVGTAGCLADGPGGEDRTDGTPTDEPTPTHDPTSTDDPTATDGDDVAADRLETSIGEVERLRAGPVVHGGVTSYAYSPEWYVAALTDPDHLEDVRTNDAGDALAAFLDGTTLDEEYLVVVQSWVNTDRYAHVLEDVTEPDDGHLRVEASIERTEDHPGPAAEVIRTLFVRLSRGDVPAPDRVTAAITGTHGEALLEDRYELRMVPLADGLERPARYVGLAVAPGTVRSTVREAVGTGKAVDVAADVAAFLEPYDYLVDDGVIAFDVDGDELAAERTAHWDLFRDRDAYVALADLPADVRAEVTAAITEGSTEHRRSPRIVGTPYLGGAVRDGDDVYDPTFEQAGEFPDH